MNQKNINLTMPSKKDADRWVQDKPKKTNEKMKRFTVDVPEGLHKRVKVQCFMQGKLMADVLREILEREFPAEHTAI
ncbi:MAG: hypothetical protein JJ964_08320 [Rhizobiales bacterium]|nr:hypothetical protein [Hyphomicrobiales bacterium]